MLSHLEKTTINSDSPVTGEDEPEIQELLGSGSHYRPLRAFDTLDINSSRFLAAGNHRPAIPSLLPRLRINCFPISGERKLGYDRTSGVVVRL